MKNLFWFVLAIALFAALAYGIYVSPVLRIQNIEFDSQYGLDLETLSLYSGLAHGDFYFDVSEKAISESLLGHPFVKDATVTKKFPNTVVIDIVSRQHFCVVRYLDMLISIDDEAIVLGVLTEAGDSFVVTGLPLDSYSAGRTIKITKLYVLQNVINYIKLFEIARLSPEKNVRFEDNCIYFEVDGLFVNFGLGENYEKRFNDFLVIYKDLRKKGVEKGTIDISSDGLPVYRPFGD